MEVIDCTNCDGWGRSVESGPFGMGVRTCPNCKGTGLLNAKTLLCPTDHELLSQYHKKTRKEKNDGASRSQ